MLLPLGCGPVEYVAQVGGRASSALSQARREKADVLAPYEYTAAGEYLKKSKEEAGRSQFETAIEYGKRSEELANRARALSRERKAGRAWDRDPTQPPGAQDKSDAHDAPATDRSVDEASPPQKRSPRSSEGPSS